MKKDSVFSPEGMERLRTPEKLDSLFVITRPIPWMAVAAIAVFLASIVLWSVFGILSASVSGVGVILDAGGLANIVHDSSGPVSEILVRPGSIVEEGDVVARLAVPTLESDVVFYNERLQQSASYHETLANLSSFNGAVNKLETTRDVVSRIRGVVSEVLVNPGDYLSAGASIVCTVRKEFFREELAAALYVPVNNGKRIKPGMTAKLVISEADPTEGIQLMAVVQSVSEYPTSTAGIIPRIANPELAQSFLSQLGGSAYEVRLTLIRDAESPSGYLWTSRFGKQPKPTAGMYYTADVVVERLPPLHWLFFKFNELLHDL